MFTRGSHLHLVHLESGGLRVCCALGLLKGLDGDEIRVAAGVDVGGLDATIADLEVAVEARREQDLVAWIDPSGVRSRGVPIVVSAQPVDACGWVVVVGRGREQRPAVARYRWRLVLAAMGWTRAPSLVGFPRPADTTYWKS
jgi:hypothetical protein